MDMEKIKAFLQNKGAAAVSFAILLAAAAFALKYGADHRPFSQNQTAMDTAMKSIVYLCGYNGEGEEVSQGSGFVILDSAHVMVNLSTIIPSQAYCVFTTDGRSFMAAEVSAYDAEWDWAVLRLEEDTGLAPLELGNSGNPDVGSDAVVLCAAGKTQRMAAKGTFNGMEKDSDLAGKAIKINADYLPFAGGAVFDSSGEIRGLTRAGEGQAAQGSVHAIPAGHFPQSLSQWTPQTPVELYYTLHPEEAYQQACVPVDLNILCGDPTSYDNMDLVLEEQVDFVTDLEEFVDLKSQVLGLVAADQSEVLVVLSDLTAVAEGMQWKKGMTVRVYGTCFYRDGMADMPPSIVLDAQIVEILPE